MSGPPPLLHSLKHTKIWTILHSLEHQPRGPVSLSTHTCLSVPNPSSSPCMLLHPVFSVVAVSSDSFVLLCAHGGRSWWWMSCAPSNGLLQGEQSATPGPSSLTRAESIPQPPVPVSPSQQPLPFGDELREDTEQQQPSIRGPRRAVGSTSGYNPLL